MILAVTISVALGVLLLIKLLIDSSYIAAILLVILFLIGWFIFNAFFGPAIFIIKPNMRIYFVSRVRGESHEWALQRVIESRYPLSHEKRDYVKLNILDKISKDQSEEEQLKDFVYMILCFEHKPPPTAHVREGIYQQIDNIYDSLRKKYAFKDYEVDLRKRAQIHCDQARSCINDKQDINLAIAEYDKALNIDPNYAEAYFARANMWYLSGDIERAISDCSSCIRVNPCFSKSYALRAGALGQKGDLDGAIADITKAVELNPEEADSYWHRANLYRKKGEYDRAAGDYIKAIDICPNIHDGAIKINGLDPQDSPLDEKLPDYLKTMHGEIKTHISSGIRKGFLTINELKDLIPNNVTSPEQRDFTMEIIFHLLGKLHIDFIDNSGKRIETSHPILRMLKES